MVKIELVRDPSVAEDDFVIVYNDGEITGYRETSFEVEIDRSKNHIKPIKEKEKEKSNED